MIFHHSVILWIVRHTWKQPHHLITPVIEWMESQCSYDLKFKSNFCIHCSLPAYYVFSLVPMGLITSATTLVSVRNTRVFRTALMALMEPRTLWLRIPRYPSPGRRVALHSISKMYFSYLSERMWSVNLDASISGVSDPRRAFLPAFRVTGSAGNMSGSTSNHSHVFSLYSHLCIYVSMYLYSYPSTHAISGLAAGGAWEQFEVRLKMMIEWTQRYTPRPWSRDFGDALGGGNRAYLEIHLEAVMERVWGYALGGHDRVNFQAVIELVRRYTWRQRSSKFGDALGGRDRSSLEMHWEAEMEWTQRCTWRLWSSEFGDAQGGRDGVNSEMHLEAVIDRVWRCTGRPRSSELRDALGGRGRASLEMHWEAEMEWTQRCTWRPWSIEFGDALGGRDRVNSEMHLEAVVERLWRCTRRPRWSELRDALGGRDQSSLEIHLEAAIERVWRCTCRPWTSEFGRVLGGGQWTALRDSIHPVVHSQPWECDKVTLPLKLLWRTGWWRSIGREVHRKVKLHSGVNSKSWEWRDDRQS